VLDSLKTFGWHLHQAERTRAANYQALHRRAELSHHRPCVLQPISTPSKWRRWGMEAHAGLFEIIDGANRMSIKELMARLAGARRRTATD